MWYSQNGNFSLKTASDVEVHCNFPTLFWGNFQHMLESETMATPGLERPASRGLITLDIRGGEKPCWQKEISGRSKIFCKSKWPRTTPPTSWLLPQGNRKNKLDWVTLSVVDTGFLKYKTKKERQERRQEEGRKQRRKEKETKKRKRRN